MGVFAFSRNVSLGIDVEVMRMVQGMDRVVDHMFCAREKQQIYRVEPAQRQRSFLACWTRKEAYAKAIGRGLLAGFDKFWVDADADEQEPRIYFVDASGTSEHWHLRDLSSAGQYACAIAYNGAERAISIYEGGSADAIIGTTRA